MTTGLGVLDLAILQAFADLGAHSKRPHIKSARVLGELHARTGIGPLHAYEPLCDLVRPWVVHLALVDFHGNFGSQEGFGPAGPRYTESRLSPLGEAALASERGDIGPLPIALINGDCHVGGMRPPLDPRRAVAAIRAAAVGATDAEVLATLGAPSFPTGCDVSGDVAGWAAGALASLELAARISIDDGRLVISHVPPGASLGDIATAIDDHISEIAPPPPQASGGVVGVGVTIGYDNVYEPLPDRDRLVITPPKAADLAALAEFAGDVWGVRSELRVHLGAPVVDLIRAAAADRDDLDERLAMIEAAVRH